MNQPPGDALLQQIADFVDPTLHLPLSRCARLSRGDDGSVAVELLFPAQRYAPTLLAALREAYSDALSGVEMTASWRVETHAVRRNLKPLGEIKNIVAVASAKGGVGKSTTAANLALALAAEGGAVGLLDADIYGPSQPMMMGIGDARPVSPDGKHIEPLYGHGVACMSVGFLVDPEQPMVWRGPMVTQALRQLLNDTDWGELDYLIIDLPPGTGDIQLTLSQTVPLSGAVIVTTPQDIALLDARRGLKMFEKVEVPVLGIVENMSTHVCSQCGHEEAIFGRDGGTDMAAQYEVPLLAALPLDVRIREQADGGAPTVASEPDGDLARHYFEIARGCGAGLAQLGKDYSRAFPKIVVEDT